MGLFRVESVEYFPSNMEDMPATRVVYAPVDLVQGSAPPAGVIVTEYLGGPYRNEAGEEVAVTLPLHSIDEVGSSVYAAFSPLDSDSYQLAEVGTKFSVSDGVVQPTPASEAYGVAGMRVEALDALVAAWRP